VIRKRRRFTTEFKAEAVRLAASSGRPLAQIARELGVHEQTLGRWKQKAGGLTGDRLVSEEELRRLRQELSRVTEERDILKKALVFFAGRSR